VGGLGGIGARVAERASGISSAVNGVTPIRSRMLDYDYSLLWVTIALLGLGIVMVYSASIAMPDSPKYAQYHDYFFLVRHLVSIATAVVASIIAFKIPVSTWDKYAPKFFLFSLFLLVIVLIPHIGKGVNGARRWIPLGITNMQPSEIMKLAVTIYAANYTVRKQEFMHSIGRGFLPMAVAVGFVWPSLPAEPDVSFDWVLLVAFAAYSGGGGTINAALTHWLRDKGVGMAGTIESRPVVVGGESVRFARDGMTFAPTEANLGKWRQWWRYLRTDFWYLWTAGCLTGMALPALLAAHFATRGEIWTGVGAPAWLAQAVGWRYGYVVWTLVLLTGFAILALTQVGIVEGFARSVTDILWTARARGRAPGAEGPAGRLYYAVLVAFTAAGCTAMTLADPFRLILIGANVAALNFVLLSLHTVWINRALLPRELRPSLWRELGVLACGAFFAALLAKVLRDPARLSGLLG